MDVGQLQTAVHGLRISSIRIIIRSVFATQLSKNTILLCPKYHAPRINLIANSKFKFNLQLPPVLPFSLLTAINPRSRRKFHKKLFQLLNINSNVKFPF